MFAEDIATVADNAAFAVTDTEMLTLVGVIDFPVANFKAGGANAVCEAFNIGLALRGTTTTLYGQLVMRNAYVPVSSEKFTVELIMSQD